MNCIFVKFQVSAAMVKFKLVVKEIKLHVYRYGKLLFLSKKCRQPNIAIIGNLLKNMQTEH